MRNARVVTCLGGFAAYFIVLLARGWNGLDQIPSDPGYEYIKNQTDSGISLLDTTPYAHFDIPLVAAVASFVPIDFRGWVVTLVSSFIWSASALVVFKVLQHTTALRVRSFIGGLLLVTTPWAAQSAIGNYGNIRWPILVAAVTVISAEISHKETRVLPMTLASVATTVSNPLAPLLLIPLIIGVLTLTREHRKHLLIAATPPLVGLIANLLIADSPGYSSKVTAFWSDAGLFWISGQLFPVSMAAAGMAFATQKLREARPQRIFALYLFIIVVFIVVASYQLGGIADRYFVAPSALASIGVLILLNDFHVRRSWATKIVSALLTLVLMVPTVHWFFVFPYLRSGPSWSMQIKLARQQCSNGVIDSFRLITSDGQTMTDPISCREL